MYTYTHMFMYMRMPVKVSACVCIYVCICIHAYLSSYTMEAMHLLSGFSGSSPGVLLCHVMSSSDVDVFLQMPRCALQTTVATKL